MSLTRRSLLRSIAALPAAHCLNALGLAYRDTGACSTSVAGSVCVLLGGPWLISQDPQTKCMNAVTIGDSNPHRCAVEQWNCGTTPSLKLRDLHAGNSAKITVPNFTPGDYKTVFTDAFGRNPFAWVVGSSTNNVSTEPPASTQRSVVLPVPTSVHMACFLNHATVSDIVPGALKQSGVHPHVVTILEYALPSAGIFKVTLPGEHAVLAKPGDQIIFRLQHRNGSMSPCDELKHIRAAFYKNAGHIKVGAQARPVKLQIDTDTSYTRGTDDEGFQENELGIHPPTATCRTHEMKPPNSRSDTYANCAGSGLVSGPTS